MSKLPPEIVEAIEKEACQKFPLGRPTGYITGATVWALRAMSLVEALNMVNIVMPNACCNDALKNFWKDVRGDMEV